MHTLLMLPAVPERISPHGREIIKWTIKTQVVRLQKDRPSSVAVSCEYGIERLGSMQLENFLIALRLSDFQQYCYMTFERRNISYCIEGS
jgi:hypothetical protein